MGEVYSFEDFKEHGTEVALRAAGKLRMEGRKYLVQDGVSQMCLLLLFPLAFRPLRFCFSTHSRPKTMLAGRLFLEGRRRIILQEVGVV